ncbi:MAG: SIR2 family NAD-dependent protein deacylase [bacterium]
MNNFARARQIVPQQLLDEIERGNCIPFIGAGVTAEAQVGIPGGRELAQLLARECAERSKSQLKLDDIKNEGLERLADRFISIVELAQLGFGRPELDKFLEHNIPPRGHQHPSLGTSSFPFLVNIPWQKDKGSIIITTNWDEMIEDGVEKYTRKRYDQITKDEDMPMLGTNPLQFKIIKLHGTIKATRELLITQTQFDALLAFFFTSQLYGFLSHAFVTRTIVFAGYGLQDQTFRLVNALINRIVNQPGYKRTRQHYAVMGDDPDPVQIAFWRGLGIEILPLKALDFFRYLYSETNQFVNRDEQRKLDKLRDEPLYAFVGPAGVGKSYLLRRIDNDLNAFNGQTVHTYSCHLLYKFPASDNLSPEDRCIDFLNELSKKVGMILDIYNPTQDKFKFILDQTQALRNKVFRSCLLLIDCSGKPHEVILKMLDALLEDAQVGVRLNAIVASRVPLEWKGSAKRVFKRNTEWLAPFTKGHIALCLRFQALLEADFHLDKSDLDVCTAEIYKITRGHPQAVKILLERISATPLTLKNSQLILQYLSNEAVALNNEIVNTVVLKEMLSEVKDWVLIEILQNALCLFRKINASIIQDMMNSSFWQIKWKNTFDSVLLLKELQVYYIANLARYGAVIYHLDPVIRRIFSQQMRNTGLPRFLEINAKNTEMYIEQAEKSRDERQRTYIIESLFHKLHSSTKKTAPIQQRFDEVCTLLRHLMSMLASSDSNLDQPTLRLRFKREFEEDQEFMDDFVDQFGPEKYEDFIELIQ